MPEASGMGRPTTYVREVFRLRASGALDGLSAPAIDTLTYLCHLADCYGRDAVFKRHAEIADTLGRSLRNTGQAVSALADFRCPAGTPYEGRAVVHVDAHHASPAGGYRRGTRFVLGEAFPAEARWLGSGGLRLSDLPEGAAA